MCSIAGSTIQLKVSKWLGKNDYHLLPAINREKWRWMSGRQTELGKLRTENLGRSFVDQRSFHNSYELSMPGAWSVVSEWRPRYIGHIHGRQESSMTGDYSFLGENWVGRFWCFEFEQGMILTSRRNVRRTRDGPFQGLPTSGQNLGHNAMCFLVLVPSLSEGWVKLMWHKRTMLAALSECTTYCHLSISESRRKCCGFMTRHLNLLALSHRVWGIWMFFVVFQGEWTVVFGYSPVRADTPPSHLFLTCPAR